MRLMIMAALVMAVSTGVQAASISVTGPDRRGMLEGQAYNITWKADGVTTVSLAAYGTKTLLGGESRGVFTIPIADSVPASQGVYSWTVPWIDAIAFFVKLKGFDSAGKQIAETERGYAFRPAVMAGRSLDGIYLDLHDKIHQRLYVQKAGQLTQAYLSTSSAQYDWRPPGSHTQTPHDHAGTFSVLEKKPMHWSKLFQVEMPWAMRYHGGHFIHATPEENYPLLGTPASSGCNRLTYADAYELYHMTPVGTRVVVIGPGG